MVQLRLPARLLLPPRTVPRTLHMPHLGPRLHGLWLIAAPSGRVQAVGLIFLPIVSLENCRAAASSTCTASSPAVVDGAVAGAGSKRRLGLRWCGRLRAPPWAVPSSLDGVHPLCGKEVITLRLVRRDGLP